MPSSGTIGVFIDNGVKVLTIALAVLTGLNTYALNKANRQLDTLKAQIDRDKVFSDYLFTQIPRLVGRDVPAKMAFAGLWILAHDPETQHGLVEVASVSGDDALKQVAQDLSPEYSTHDIQNSPQLTATQVFLQSQVTKGTQTHVTKLDTGATSAAANLLAKLTPPTTTGYVYLGIADHANQTFQRDATIDQSRVPKAQDIVAPVGSINLRETYPVGAKLGEIKGEVTHTDRLQINEIRPIPISRGEDAVWASVTILEQPSPRP